MAYMMSDPADPVPPNTDAIEAKQEDPDIPPAPPNSAQLMARPAPDRVHIRLRVDYDVTHLREDGQKLLLHYVLQGLKEFEQEIKRMGPIEVASKLANLERVKAVKKNGQP
jgi:hypothetical protein